MAFTAQTSRFFTKQDVESLNPNQYGIYGIFRQGQWVYVGKGDIRQRLLAHLAGDNPAILAWRPTHWVGEVCSDPHMSNREKQLIVELNPPCNRKVG